MSTRTCGVLLGVLLVFRTLSSATEAAPSIRHGDWTGWYALPARAAHVQIDLQLHGSTALVALGPGHAALQSVGVRRVGTDLGFSVPGVPAPVMFLLHIQGSRLLGTASQGRVSGTIQLSFGKPTLNRFLGLYHTTDGDALIITDLRHRGAPPWQIDVGIDGIRALYPMNATRYAIGSGSATRQPVAGTIHFNRNGSGLTESMTGAAPMQAMRVPLRQLEVRFPSGRLMLAATLTLPEGPGPFPAVVMVHGAGPSLRDEGQTFSAFLALHGIASLTPDKRGNGESGGAYPGDKATDTAIEAYTADAIAGGRFLATQPTIAAGRIGLFGGSQAGWIIPNAAVHSGSLFSFAVILSGPVVSVGESDYYAGLTNQGEVASQMTPAQIDTAVRTAGPSGFDPRPSLRALHIPVFWVYGGLDQNQPTRLDLPALLDLKASTGADFSWVVFPKANHGLVDTQTGLNSEAAAAPTYAHGLFASIATWLQGHGVGS